MGKRDNLAWAPGYNYKALLNFSVHLCEIWASDSGHVFSSYLASATSTL